MDLGLELRHSSEAACPWKYSLTVQDFHVHKMHIIPTSLGEESSIRRLAFVHVQ